jgi:hypothetical protein
MPVDTSRAIGAVTELLAHQLRAHTAVPAVTAGRPEPGEDTRSRLNVFLFEVLPDASLRSHVIDGRPSPAWLVLRYLVTAYASGGSSDSSDAHHNLGEAIRALHGLAYLPVTTDLPPDDERALRANPEPLKVTFLPAGSDLLGRLMQGTDEKYRCSVAVEVRPVMIAGAEPDAATLLVGRRYVSSSDPRTPGVHVLLDPVGAPVLTGVAPTRVEAGVPVRLTGAGFVEGDRARLAGVDRAITRDGSALVAVFDAAALADRVGPGVFPLAVARAVPASVPARWRVSEPIAVRLVPTLDTAVVASVAPDPSAAGRAIVEVDLFGQLLGRAEDECVVGLWRDGRTVAHGDELVALAGPAQTARRVTIRDVEPSATYRVIVRVNGGQATWSPEIAVGTP